MALDGSVTIVDKAEKVVGFLLDSEIVSTLGLLGVSTRASALDPCAQASA